MKNTRVSFSSKEFERNANQTRKSRFQRRWRKLAGIQSDTTTYIVALRKKTNTTCEMRSTQAMLCQLQRASDSTVSLCRSSHDSGGDAPKITPRSSTGDRTHSCSLIPTQRPLPQKQTHTQSVCTLDPLRGKKQHIYIHISVEEKQHWEVETTLQLWDWLLLLLVRKRLCEPTGNCLDSFKRGHWIHSYLHFFHFYSLLWPLVTLFRRQMYETPTWRRGGDERSRLCDSFCSARGREPALAANRCRAVSVALILQWANTV